jgi:predicted amidohydrolase
MKSSDTLNIVSLQPIIQLHNLSVNLSNYEGLFEEHMTSISEADAICFPEYWNGLRIKSTDHKSIQDSEDFLKNIAQSYSCWIIGGSSVIKAGNNYYNRSIIIDDKGHNVGIYNKKRLFGYEKFQDLTPGEDFFFWDLGLFRSTVCICNDLWDPLFIQELIQRKIDVIFVPALTVVPEESYTNYGQFIWYNLAFTRAKEGAMAVIVSDTAKAMLSDPFWSTGASCIVDPSKRFINQELTGKNMINKIESGKRGIVSMKISYQSIRDQKDYREAMGLLDSE